MAINVLFFRQNLIGNGVLPFIVTVNLAVVGTVEVLHNNDRPKALSIKRVINVRTVGTVQKGNIEPITLDKGIRLVKGKGI